MANKKKTYSPEFKQAAVKLVVESKQSVPQAAKDLGMGESTLYKWVEQSQSSHEKASQNSKLTEELKRLRSEVSELKKKLATTEEQREILKKAAAYFAAQTQ